MTDSPSKPKREYQLAIRRPVTTAMVFLTLVVFGWKSYQQLSINLMPDISYPTLTVRTEFEGAAPEDVETLLTRPLEETLAIVPGMVEISSTSSPGLSEIVMEFTWDTDMNTAQQDVRDRLDLYEPPEEVTQKPVILRYDPTLDPVMRVAIIGPDLSHINSAAERERESRNQLIHIRDIAERQIKSDLEGELGIAQVLVKGGREQEIQILVDAERLKSLGLSLSAVANSLSQQNINLSGGSLREGKTEYLVRTINEYPNVEDIRRTRLVTADGNTIRLTDVARIIEGEKDRETIVRLEDREAVELEIFKWGDANTVQVCNKLKDLFGFERGLSGTERVTRWISGLKAQNQGLEQVLTEEELHQRELAKTLRRHLGKDEAEFRLISDQSRFILASVKEVQSTAVMGGLLALIILGFFLRELRSTFITGIAIPISIIATFIPMFMRGISLNIMSLGGLALGVGMLVDNSIVVLESIFRCKEEGDGPVEAADRGTREVGGAVAASTFTTIAVFLPIAFVKGIAGQLFGDLALTVTFSLLASLLVALYLIPMIASRQKLALLAGKDVVWMMRAYREGHAEGQGVAGALFGMIPRGFRYTAERFVEIARDSLGPFIRAFRPDPERPEGIRVLAVRIGAVLILPLAMVHFIMHLLLSLFTGTLLTILFPLCLLVFSSVRGIGLLVHFVLWLPLEAFDLVFRAFREVYAVSLRQLLRFSPIILLLVLALAIHSGMLATQLGRELIPPLKQGEFGLRMQAPAGTRLEETESRARKLTAFIQAIPEIGTVSLEVGGEDTSADSDQGENIATFTISLKDPTLNAQRQDAIIDALRRTLVEETSDALTFTLPTLFSFKTAVELQIRGDDLDELKRIGDDALEAIRGIPGITDPVAGLKDAELSMKEGYPEVIIQLDRDLLASKGLDPAQVADSIRREVQGEVPTRFSAEGYKIDIRVRADRAGLSSVNDLRQLSVVDSNPPLPLSSVARITVKPGPSEIRRIDQRQVAVVTANVEGRDLGAVSDDILARLQNVEKPRDFAFVLGGQNRELQTSYQSLQFALLLAIFLVYVVMACQFESIWHPALVMFAVPLAFIGVIYVLVWLDVSVSIVVFIGGIILAGIVVNDAIVLVDYINQLRARGMNKRDAVVEAGRVRLRPIIMTTLTTVLGLIPMAISSGEGAEIRQPMAITVMAGLSSATLLTLVIIPMAYDLFSGRDKKA